MRLLPRSSLLTAVVPMTVAALIGLASPAAVSAVPSAAEGWSSPVVVDARAGAPVGVACPAVDACWAVDSDGNVLRFDGTDWTGPALVRPPRRAVRASPARPSNFCLVVGSAKGVGVSVAWDGQDLGDAGGRRRRHLRPSPACLRLFCLASDLTGHVYAFQHGGWGHATRLGTRRDFVRSISCATPTFCVAVRRRGGDIFDGSELDGRQTPSRHTAASRRSPARRRRSAWQSAIGRPPSYDGDDLVGGQAHRPHER